MRVSTNNGRLACVSKNERTDIRGDIHVLWLDENTGEGIGKAKVFRFGAQWWTITNASSGFS
jgi:hypothetical protein